MKLCFIISLPRSGSTLVQRIVGSHSQVATDGESWLLLPLLYSDKIDGTVSEFGHVPAAKAISDFYKLLPDGSQDYYSAINQFVYSLYGKYAEMSDATHFVDKTPRYHLIVEQLFTVFPDAKFVFIWRNPLAIVASIMKTFGNNRWNLGTSRVDLFQGLGNMIQAFEANQHRALAIKYEEVVMNPDQTIKKLFDYLELPNEPDVSKKFSQLEFSGQMSGDPVGTRQYKAISQAPLTKWGAEIANPIRKRWCSNYLNWIGQTRLATMGYDLVILQNELNLVPTKYDRILTDILDIAFSEAKITLQLEAIKISVRKHRVHKRNVLLH